MQSSDMAVVNNIKPLQIVYVIETFPSSTEYFILNEILSLEKQGVNLLVLSIRKPKSSIFASGLDSLKASVLYANDFHSYFLILHWFTILKKISNHSKFPFFSWSFFRQLKNISLALSVEKQLKNYNITHVHAHFAFIATDVGYILSRLLNVNFSFTAHAQDIYLNQKRIIGKIESATFVVTCTHYNLRYLNQLTKNRFNEKIYQIYHGIPEERNGFLQENKTVNLTNVRVLTVARLVEKKGITYLLRAIKLLLDRGIKVSCEIIGDGPLKKELVNFVNKANINSYITFKGTKTRSEVLQAMRVSDVFILPSITASNGDMDGLPNVLLEAMTVGVPVISTNISAVPELVEDNITGIMVSEKDEKAIADAILKLIDDPALYQSILINAKNKVTQGFNVNVSTKKMIDLFRKYEKN